MVTLVVSLVLTQKNKTGHLWLLEAAPEVKLVGLGGHGFKSIGSSERVKSIGPN